jgi:hypothetical protein
MVLLGDTATIVNDGLAEATNGGKLDLAAAITGHGQFLIGQTSILELGGSTAEAVTFECTRGGTLYLDKASDFSGTVSGLAQADFTDLANFAFSSNPVISNIIGTGAAGTTTDVTITDGSLTTTLHFLNQHWGISHRFCGLSAGVGPSRLRWCWDPVYSRAKSARCQQHDHQQHRRDCNHQRDGCNLHRR